LRNPLLNPLLTGSDEPELCDSNGASPTHSSQASINLNTRLCRSWTQSVSGISTSSVASGDDTTVVTPSYREGATFSALEDNLSFGTGAVLPVTRQRGTSVASSSASNGARVMRKALRPQDPPTPSNRSKVVSFVDPPRFLMHNATPLDAGDEATAPLLQPIAPDDAALITVLVDLEGTLLYVSDDEDTVYDRAVTFEDVNADGSERRTLYVTFRPHLKRFLKNAPAELVFFSRQSATRTAALAAAVEGHCGLSFARLDARHCRPRPASPGALGTSIISQADESVETLPGLALGEPDLLKPELLKDLSILGRPIGRTLSIDAAEPAADSAFAENLLPVTLWSAEACDPLDDELLGVGAAIKAARDALLADASLDIRDVLPQHVTAA
jgi:hypothetical protein